MATEQQKRIKNDLANVIAACVRTDATENEMRGFADTRNQIAAILNRRVKRPEDQAAVLGILLLQMFDGTPDDIAPEPS